MGASKPRIETSNLSNKSQIADVSIYEYRCWVLISIKGISEKARFSAGSNSSKKGVGKDKDPTVSEGQQPSFCVLLHGSLKMEKMGAVVKLRSVLIYGLFLEKM